MFSGLEINDELYFERLVVSEAEPSRKETEVSSKEERKTNWAVRKGCFLFPYPLKKFVI